MAESKDGILKVAFWIIGIAIAVAVVAGFVMTAIGLALTGPVGILGLIVLFAGAVIVFVVLRDRLTNKDDDYYSKNVDE